MSRPAIPWSEVPPDKREFAVLGLMRLYERCNNLLAECREMGLKGMAADTEASLDAVKSALRHLGYALGDEP